MEEPVKKKPKVDGEDDSDDSDDGDNDLQTLQKSLLGNCLCTVSEATLYKSFQDPRKSDSDCQFQDFDFSDWDTERILKFLTCIHILCEIYIKQNSDGLMCSRISDVCDALIKNEHGIVDQMVNCLMHNNQFVCYSASRALSSYFIVCKTNVDMKWLEKITEFALTTTVPRKMSTTLDVIKRVIEWKDNSVHPMEDRSNGSHAYLHPMCNATSLLDTVKCICIKVLETKWPELVKKVDGLISSYTSENECAIISFLGLWESIISVKANLSVVDTKPFYSNLYSFVVILNSSVPSAVWKHLLNLFNEVLCYGSTLALQEYLAEEPCALAHHVMRSVKDWRLLDLLPFRGGSGRFGGGSGEGDRPLLQKMALLVLKSVAVTVKETRYESSSDSSVGSEADDLDADMAVIERSIREVLRQLDNCVKQLLPFHPETPIAQWVVQLFADQDDALVEAMVCCLDVTVGLYYRPTMVPNQSLSPTNTLIAFLHVVSHDPDVLLDLLVSNETCFLLYLLRILKFMRRNWSEFVSCCSHELDDTMSVFIRLRMAIDRLVRRALFPYNISPVLRLLEKCEELYEGGTCD
ncbi:UNVERIFIED_CONTAM: hypothetical protein PYX00_006700 [Menopon gallinae]|uniref:Protein lines n=1 Tax=Menopon gallinae TaxID=328185 RepID=A0AAW2HWM3_9NEOP